MEQTAEQNKKHPLLEQIVDSFVPPAIAGLAMGAAISPETLHSIPILNQAFISINNLDTAGEVISRFWNGGVCMVAGGYGGAAYFAVKKVMHHYKGISEIVSPALEGAVKGVGRNFKRLFADVKGLSANYDKLLNLFDTGKYIKDYMQTKNIEECFNGWIASAVRGCGLGLFVSAFFPDGMEIKESLPITGLVLDSSQYSIRMVINAAYHWYLKPAYNRVKGFVKNHK